MPASALLIFLICSLIMVGAGMLVSHLLAPRSKNIQKEEPYECGVPTRGTAWIQFRVGYYLFAIIFLIFDVETVFIVPWAVAFTETGLAAFIEILIFLGVLGLGLIYAWKKGALKWE